MRLWVGADHGAEGLGDGGEGDVAVPAEVGAALEVVQAQAGFQLAVVVLDPPSDLGQADQLGDGGVLWQGGQPVAGGLVGLGRPFGQDRKSTRLNSSHVRISYAVFCLKKKKNAPNHTNSHIKKPK